MFHLEFNLHGGGRGKGFADDDYQGILNAMKSIEESCAKYGGETTNKKRVDSSCSTRRTPQRQRTSS
jgi:hypothetical protein